MPAHCYIHGTGNRGDAYYGCNNCGGLVCEDHGFRDDHTKNCWCEDCLPTVAADIVDAVSGAITQTEPAVLQLRDRVREQFQRSQRLREAAARYEEEYRQEPLLGLVALLRNISQILRESHGVTR